jgi:hypothetical protein
MSNGINFKNFDCTLQVFHENKKEWKKSGASSDTTSCNRSGKCLHNSIINIISIECDKGYKSYQCNDKFVVLPFSVEYHLQQQQ